MMKGLYCNETDRKDGNREERKLQGEMGPVRGLYKIYKILCASGDIVDQLGVLLLECKFFVSI